MHYLVWFGLVWFGGHPNQLQRSPLQCPWSGIVKKVYHVGCRGKYALFGLVWFGGHPNQLQRSPLQCPWSAISKNVYYVGVYLSFNISTFVSQEGRGFQMTPFLISS